MAGPVHNAVLPINQCDSNTAKLEIPEVSDSDSGEPSEWVSEELPEWCPNVTGISKIEYKT